MSPDQISVASKESPQGLGLDENEDQIPNCENDPVISDFNGDGNKANNKSVSACLKGNKGWKNLKIDKKANKSKKSDNNDEFKEGGASQPTKIQNWRNLSNIGVSKKPSLTYQNKAQNPNQKDGFETGSNNGRNDVSSNKDDLENIKNLISHNDDGSKT